MGTTKSTKDPREKRTRATIITSIKKVVRDRGIDQKTVKATCRTRFGKAPGGSFRDLTRPELASLERMLIGAKRKAESEAGAAASNGSPSDDRKGPSGLPVTWKGDLRPLIVHENRSLFWPLPGNQFRCTGGSIIHPADPFLWVKGYPDQRYKVRQMTDRELEALGAVPEPTPCTNRRMFREYEKRGLDWIRWEPVSVHHEPLEQEVEGDDDAAEAGATDIEKGWEVPDIDADEALDLEGDHDLEDEAAEMERRRAQRKGPKAGVGATGPRKGEGGDASGAPEPGPAAGDGLDAPAEAPTGD